MRNTLVIGGTILTNRNVVELMISNSGKLLANVYSTRFYIIIRKLVFAVLVELFANLKTKICGVSLQNKLRLN